MISRGIRWCCGVLVCLLPLGGASAQDVAGALVGRVVDSAGAPVADVEITLAGRSLQGQRRIVTGGQGYFRAVDLPVGSYSVRVRSIGYRPVSIEAVRIRLGTTSTIGEIALQPQTVVLDPIHVTAERLSIDPVSTTVGSVLESEEYEQLPVARDHQSIISILPHANESFVRDGINIGGGTGLENAYFIDGVNVTDPQAGFGGTRLPYNFIQSVQVKTGGYEAEYGRALGAVVNAVTYTGSNQFEVNVSGFLTHDALAGSARPGLIDLRADEFHTLDVGARVSGPLARDRLWLSLAYNPRVESVDRLVLGSGAYNDRFTLHSFAAKATWRPHPRTDIELSVFGDPSVRHAVSPGGFAAVTGVTYANPEPLFRRMDEGGVIGSLRLRQRIGAAVLLHGHLSRSWARDDELPDRGASELGPTLQDNTTATWSGGLAEMTSTRQRRTALALGATFFLSRHTIKLSADLEDNVVDQRRDGWVVFRGGPAAYSDFRESWDASVHNRTPAAYVQDSWQVTRRLVVNPGLRWSRQYLIAANGSVAQRFRHEWQPRVGLVYQLGELGTQRLFASYGRFYQQLPLFASILLYVPAEASQSLYSEDPTSGNVMPDVTFNFSSDASDFPEVAGLHSSHHDEFVVGYERVLAGDFVLQARAMRRELRDAFGIGVDSAFMLVLGNYGAGGLDFLPKARRSYTALEVTLARTGAHRLQGHLSYVLSRTHGNYPGLFGSDGGRGTPSLNSSFQWEAQGANSTGLLPADRTHVVKAAVSYALRAGLTVGTLATVQSGTPLNRFGSLFFAGVPLFREPRGSAGRSPMLWDLNVRVRYDLPLRSMRPRGRVFLDWLHIGSPRRATWVDQYEFLPEDPTTGVANANPNFGAALANQPPTAVRLGLELEL